MISYQQQQPSETHGIVVIDVCLGSKQRFSPFGLLSCTPFLGRVVQHHHICCKWKRCLQVFSDLSQQLA